MTNDSTNLRDEKFDVLGIVVLFWRHRLLIISMSFVGCLILVIYGFLQRPEYRAEVSILPQPNSAPSGMLGSLASMVGSPFASAQSYEQLYSRIVVSDRLLDRAIDRKWNHHDFPDPVSIYQVFNIEVSESGSNAIRTRDLKKILRNEVIDFSLDKSTGFMNLKVTTPGDGKMAADLANFLVDELNQFNKEIRYGRAKEQHRFIKNRLAEIEMDLQDNEDSLTEFLNNNRSYASSHQLTQQFGVLNREIQASTSIWIELRKQLELAEIDLNQDKSSVSILDRAIEPVIPCNASPFLYGVSGFLLGLVACIMGLIIFYQTRYFRGLITGAKSE